MKPFAPKLDEPFEVDVKRVKRLIKDDDYKNLNRLISNWPEYKYHLKILNKLNPFEINRYVMCEEYQKIAYLSIREFSW
jgi:hypothetical protein